MDFLKKAKAQMKELEKDLNKATQALGINNDNDTSTDAPQDTPDASTDAGGDAGGDSSGLNVSKGEVEKAGAAAGAFTGSLVTSVKPKEGAASKLPLAARKSVRDDYESKKADWEQGISKTMQVPWTIVFDVGAVFSYAKEGWALQNPGKMFAAYAEAADERIKEFVKKQGEAGRLELNRLASHHVVTLEPEPKVTTAGGDIHEGKLRLLFNPEYLGYNHRDPLQSLHELVNKAGVGAGGTSSLNFEAKQNIAKDYEPKIAELTEQAKKLMNMPSLTFVPNFEANYAKVIAWIEADEDNAREVPNNWQSRLGWTTLSYFQSGFVDKAKWLGFGKDEMMQEGFAEAADKGVVELRVVDKLKEKTYNECAIEGGVLYLYTVPKYWMTNTDRIAEDLVKLL